MPSYEKALLIVNPVSGQGRGLRLGQQLRVSLESKGVVCSVRVTSGEGDARRWSDAAGSEGDGGPYDLIVPSVAMEPSVKSSRVRPEVN